MVILQSLLSYHFILFFILSHNIQDIESARFQTYYQWTPIIFFVQACFFYVSHLIWMQLESGTMKSLRLSLNDPALNTQVKAKNIQQLVDYFNSNVRRHSLYGKHYLYCLVFNVVNVILQIVITDFLLDGHFISYGWKFSYTRRVKDYTNSPAASEPNVEDIIFPKMSKCSLFLYGPSGDTQHFDGICVLPINMLHDKIFIVLWFWYLLLFILSMSSALYWLAHFFVPNYRLRHIERHLKGKVQFCPPPPIIAF